MGTLVNVDWQTRLDLLECARTLNAHENLGCSKPPKPTQDERLQEAVARFKSAWAGKTSL